VPNEPWFLYIPACLLLIRRKCLEEIGIFSEKYFHLVEDVEFCVRAQRKGWELALDPDAVLFHKGSASLPRFSPLYNYYEQRNRLFVIRQYRIERESVCLRLQDIFMILTRLFFTLMAVDKFSHFPRGARSLVFAVFDFFCDRGGKREDDLRYHTVPSLSERRPRRWKGDL
jgi:hypothetical protein